MRRTVAAAALLVFAAGCIPSRENERDPANAPDVKVSIVRFETEIEGTCANPVGVVTAASRGDCLHIDASATRDPQGHDYTLSYFVLDEAGDLVATLVDGTDQTEIRLPRRPLGEPPVASRTIGVRAEDSTGAVGFGFATLLLVNTQPFIPLPGVRFLPAGGYAWAPGAPFQIELDGRGVIDADRDDLTYCWSSAETPAGECAFGGTVEGVTRAPPRTPGSLATGAVWRTTIPSTPGRHLFSLTVRDGDIDSYPRTFEVRVGAPPLWSKSGALRRFDETLREWTEPANGWSRLVEDGSGAEWLVFYDDDAPRSLSVYRWPELTPTPATANLAGQTVQEIVGSPRPGGGARLWVAAGSSVLVYDLSADASTLTLVKTEPVPSPALALLVDTAGTLAAAGGDGYIELIPAASGQASSSLDVSASRVEGGERSPRTNEMWFTLSGGQTDPKLGSPVNFIAFKVGPDGAFDVVRQAHEHPMRQFAWADDRHFWVVYPDVGLSLVDRDRYDLVSARFPTVPYADGPLRVDASGVCHLATGSALVSVSPDGRERRVPFTGATNEISFVAKDGSIGIDRGSVLRISRTIEPNGVVAVVDLPADEPRRSIANGGVWTPSGSALLHTSEDGVATHFLTTLVDGIDSDGVTFDAPRIAMDPGERGGWLVDQDVLFRIDDLIKDREFPASEDATRIEAPGLAGYVPVGASSPAAVSPFAWMFDAATNTYATVDLTGSVDVIATLTGETPIAAVVSARANELCVFSQDDVAPTTLHHRRLSPGGGETIDSVTVAGAATMLRSPFVLGVPDRCGIVSGDATTQIFVWDSAMNLVVNHLEPGYIDSVTAAGGNSYWAGLTEAGDHKLVKFVADSSASLVRADEWTLDLPEAPVFVP